MLSQGDRGLAYEIPHLPDIETINSRISDGNHFSENLHHKNPFAAGLTEQIEGKKLEKLKMKNEELQQERFLLRHQQTLDSLEK